MNDLSLNLDLDLDFINGDINIALENKATEQAFRAIIATGIGEIREFPQIGVALERERNNDAGLQELLQRIQKNLQLDGATVRNITIINKNVRVEGNY